MTELAIARNTEDQERREMDTDNKQDAAEPSPASDGSVMPVAWAAFAPDASESRAIFWSRDEAEKVCGRYGFDLFPLYAVRPTEAMPLASAGSVAGDRPAWALVHENERLRDEILLLRLTDEEREVLPFISKTCRGRGWRDWSDVIDGLLLRLGGER